MATFSKNLKPELINSVKHIFIFLTISLALGSCVPDLRHNTNQKLELPTSFGVKQPGGTAELLDRKAFFPDAKLLALIDTAIARNFNLQTATQRIEIARGGLVLAKGNRLPDLSLNTGSSVRRFGFYTMDGIGNYDTKFSPNLGSKEQLPVPYTDFAPMLFSSWEIDIWNKLKDKKKAALNRMLASEAGRNWFITQLVSEVAAQYYMLLEFDAELEILRRNIILQQNAFDFVLIQKEAGLVNELAVEIIQAQVLSSREKQFEVQQLRLKTETDLNQLLGRFPQPIDRDSSIMKASLPPILRMGVPSDQLKNRMDIQEAELQLEAAKADISAARKAYYPALNFNGFLGLQSFNAALLLELPASLAYNAAGSLTAPLLNRRQLHSQLIQTGGEKQTAYLQYQKTVVNAFSEVFVRMNEINNIGLRLEQKQQEANVLNKSITTSNELFRTGRANYLELVNVQRNVLQAELDLVRLREGQFQSTIQLYKALGGGWQ